MPAPLVNIALPLSPEDLFSLGPNYESYSLNQTAGEDYLSYAYEKYKKSPLGSNQPYTLIDRQRTQVISVSPRALRLVYLGDGYKYEVSRNIVTHIYKLNERGTNALPYNAREEENQFCSLFDHGYLGSSSPKTTWKINNSLVAYTYEPPLNPPTTTPPEPVVPPPVNFSMTSTLPIGSTIEAARTGSVGLRLRSVQAGQITSLSFYRAPGDTTTHILRLWDAAGVLLQAVPTSSVTPGREDVDIPPVDIPDANITFTISTDASAPHYINNTIATACPDNLGLYNAVGYVHLTDPDLFPGTSNNKWFGLDVVYQQGSDVSNDPYYVPTPQYLDKIQKKKLRGKKFVSAPIPAGIGDNNQTVIGLGNTVPTGAYGVTVTLQPVPTVPVTIKVNGVAQINNEPILLSTHNYIIVEVTAATTIYLETAVVNFFGANSTMQRFVRPIRNDDLGPQAALPAGLDFTFVSDPIIRSIDY